MGQAEKIDRDLFGKQTREGATYDQEWARLDDREPSGKVSLTHPAKAKGGFRRCKHRSVKATQPDTLCDNANVQARAEPQVLAGATLQARRDRRFPSFSFHRYPNQEAGDFRCRLEMTESVPCCCREPAWFQDGCCIDECVSACVVRRQCIAFIFRWVACHHAES